MRPCIVTKKIWVPTEGQHKVVCPGTWVDQPKVDAFFHRFTSESSDGEISTMAIVEFSDGSVDTIPLSWLTLKPYTPTEGLVALKSEAVTMVSPEVNTRLINVIEACSDSFQIMCRDVANQIGSWRQ